MLRLTSSFLSRTQVVALVVLTILAPASSRAAMYGSVTGYPSGWPSYFSGTNCRVVGTVGAGAPAWLTDAQMYIDGVLVRSYTDTGQHAPYVNWQVIFDSSRVMDGLPITFRVTDHNNIGQSVDFSRQCTAYNKAYVLGNSTLTFGVQAKNDIGFQTAGMNHTTTSSSTVAKTAILAEIPAETAFYIYSHAGPGWFKDCPNTGTITAADVTSAVASKTSSQPKYNFVHIDGCNSCGSVGSIDSSLATAFGITGSDNQAFLGWLSLVADSSNNVLWSKTVWSGLKAGKTVQKAVDDATLAVTPKNTDGSTATSKILGDTRTTLHATYFLSPTEGVWHN